jgi:hypothetical protein
LPIPRKSCFDGYARFVVLLNCLHAVGDVSPGEYLAALVLQIQDARCVADA